MQLMGACKSRYTLTPGKHIELEVSPFLTAVVKTTLTFTISAATPLQKQPQNPFSYSFWRVDVINGQEEADVYGQQCNEVCVRAICGPIPIVGRTHCLKITKICKISHLNLFFAGDFFCFKSFPIAEFSKFSKISAFIGLF